MTFKLEEIGNSFTYQCLLCGAIVRAPQWGPLGKERHAAPIRTNPLNLQDHDCTENACKYPCGDNSACPKSGTLTHYWPVPPPKGDDGPQPRLY
jgi:hypothetical protein